MKTRALATLEHILEDTGPMAVAVSGGVDSMTLAVLVHEIHPDSLMMHARSPAVPQAAGRRVVTYAQRFGWNLKLLEGGEMQDPDYRKNPLNRCYYCKSNLYDLMRRHTGLPLISGTNHDDLADFRPGLKAAAEHAVRHPYVEAGIDKEGVRALAERLGLSELQELPASPCLSSRISTGTVIDADRLRLIDTVEEQLRRVPDLLPQGGTVRCRIRRKRITIELDRADVAEGTFPRVNEIRQLVGDIVAGHGAADLDPDILIEPYRRGSSFIGSGLSD